jgi:hypothetical protein
VECGKMVNGDADNLTSQPDYLIITPPPTNPPPPTPRTLEQGNQGEPNILRKALVRDSRGQKGRGKMVERV